MTTPTDPQPDPLLWSARRERARRWLSTDLRGYPTLSAEAETEESLATDPKQEQQKKRSGAQRTDERCNQSRYVLQSKQAKTIFLGRLGKLADM